MTAAEKYNKSDLVNLGSGQEISVRDLLEMITALVGCDAKIRWNADKPDGQPRRSLDTSRAAKEFGWRSTTPLRQGLQKTIDWYLNHTSDSATAATQP